MEQIQIVKKLLASERKQRQVDTSNPKSHKKGNLSVFNITRYSIIN